MVLASKELVDQPVRDARLFGDQGDRCPGVAVSAEAASSRGQDAQTPPLALLTATTVIAGKLPGFRQACLPAVRQFNRQLLAVIAV